MGKKVHSAMILAPVAKFGDNWGHDGTQSAGPGSVGNLEFVLVHTEKISLCDISPA